MRFPKLGACVLLVGVGLSGCSTNQASNGFEKELTSEQREAAIKQLQTEAAWGEVSKP
jgi:hypothetical protein